jgi:hypothetical protein
MSRKERIEQKFKEFQDQWDLEFDVITRLRKKHIQENDEPTKIKLENEIKEKKADLKKIEAQLNQLEYEKYQNPTPEQKADLDPMWKNFLWIDLPTWTDWQIL